MHRLRKNVSPGIWQSLVPMARAHPVFDLLLQDPFSRWSFEKPRGYSGDAHLLDFIYGHTDVQEELFSRTTPLGRSIYDSTRNSQSSAAVRERRELLTRYVDDGSVSRDDDLEVLTIAAGHLREADTSEALREGRIQRWVALDQDPLSVGSITRDFSGKPVEALDGSVRGLLGKAYGLGRFDLIYAAGLYDYLTRAVAVRLTRKCVQMLKPQGAFLFANFAEGIPDDAYMETFMNWTLLLRSESDMWDIINASTDRNSVEAKVFFGENRNIVYGVITRKD